MTSERMQYVLERIQQNIEFGLYKDVTAYLRHMEGPNPEQDKTIYQYLWNAILNTFNRLNDGSGDFADFAEEGLYFEIFCDHEFCSDFVNSLDDVMRSISDVGAKAKFNELDYSIVPSWASIDKYPDYVITITGDWEIAIERYANEYFPRPSAPVVYWISADEKKDILAINNAFDACLRRAE